MRVNLDTPKVNLAMKEVYLDGKLLEAVTSFDTRTGQVTFYPRNASGGFDAHVIQLKGKIDIVLKPGWRWENEAFVYREPKTKMRNFRET